MAKTDAGHKNPAQAAGTKMTKITRGVLGLGLVLGMLAPAVAQDITVPRPVARPASLAPSTDPATDAAVAAAAGAAMPVATPVIPPAPEMPDARALAPPAEQTVGAETNLPLPRFVSLKTNEGNVRRGPSLSHRIDWVFTREDMPLMITAEYGHWRRVVDREGLGGWVHYSLLSGTRTVIVDVDMQPLFARADPESAQNALLEAGVIARLEACERDWCRISSGGFRGWAPKSALWGVGADEILD